MGNSKSKGSKGPNSKYTLTDQEDTAQFEFDKVSLHNQAKVTTPDQEESLNQEIEPKKLLDGIKSVYYSSAVSDIKPEISSVFIYTHDDSLVFVSTDSFRLAEKKIKVKSVNR